ncbi:unnamed protein product [Oikopleura dioica]|uniref:FXYD domain-containing ion transport regulator n=1 Tax=Oikopleura dioica TaxID=34765 RepID=E4XYP0_OIKDI|nr:unnamed protein product [Oikopleura dioica]
MRWVSLFLSLSASSESEDGTDASPLLTTQSPENLTSTANGFGDILGKDNGVLFRGAITAVIVGLIILASILVKRCSCKKTTRKYEIIEANQLIGDDSDSDSEVDIFQKTYA